MDENALAIKHKLILSDNMTELVKKIRADIKEKYDIVVTEVESNKLP